MTTIILDAQEMKLAAAIGADRQIEAIQQRLPDRHGAKSDDGWTLHIEGAAGEIAAAKALDRYWGATVNTFKDGGDMGRRIQVRTRSKHEYELIVRDSDRDSDIFVLVTGKMPRFEIVGVIEGVDAKRPEWLKTHGGRAPAYFVPHSALKRIVE